MKKTAVILFLVIPLAATAQMQALWRLDGNSNDAVNSYNGTDANITYVAGIRGNCASFNGSSSVINFGDVLDAGSSSWTYSAWVLSSTSGTQSIISKSGATSAWDRFTIITTASNGIYYGFFCGGPDSYQTNPNTTISFCDGKWHNHVMTCDRNGYLYGYIDGKMYGSVSISGGSGRNMDCAFLLGLGAYRNAGNTAWTYFLNGKIDEAYITNTVLTPAGVKNQYSLFKGFMQ
jgi:hypothetical protein